jgi:hypothetical protein
MKRILSDQEKQKVKQELSYVWKESKPHVFGALKFLFGVAVQPNKWKVKYAKLDKANKDAVQTGSFLIGFSILCIWFLATQLF